jgi:glycerol-3-phosphate dehydrogenase
MMWTQGWRDTIWSALDGQWDVIVVGGGITGAGLLRETSRVGLRALLLEADDFASGTSSRSSKFVHGGLRYLQNLQVRMTRESVQERDRLLHEGRGLVSPLGCLKANFDDDKLPGWVVGLALAFYDSVALKWHHRYYRPQPILRKLCPPLRSAGLQGGYRYFDASTDDARLVLRLIREAVSDGGVALNYARVEGLLRLQNGKVCGVVVRDLGPGGGGRTTEVKAPLVINATGAWADELRRQAGGSPRLRKLRGSHLVFAAHHLHLHRAVNVEHPRDRRWVFFAPWEGVTLVGTTDVDQGEELSTDVAISPAEADYLIEAVCHYFPALDLSLDEVQATFAGVRPVINTGKADPSKESREHALWREEGLLTVAGGKLTTFRLMALTALQTVCGELPGQPRFETKQRVLDAFPPEVMLPPSVAAGQRLRLMGRYAAEAGALVEAAQPGELEPVGQSPALWAELRWAARTEGVVHLNDLLLRRVRLGLLLPQGGLPWLDQIRAIVQPELGWDDERWQEEAAAYQSLWQRSYSLDLATK